MPFSYRYFATYQVSSHSRDTGASLLPNISSLFSLSRHWSMVTSQHIKFLLTLETLEHRYFATYQVYSHSRDTGASLLRNISSFFSLWRHWSIVTGYFATYQIFFSLSRHWSIVTSQHINFKGFVALIISRGKLLCLNVSESSCQFCYRLGGSLDYVFSFFADVCASTRAR